MKKIIRITHAGRPRWVVRSECGECTDIHAHLQAIKCKVSANTVLSRHAKGADYDQAIREAKA